MWLVMSFEKPQKRCKASWLQTFSTPPFFSIELLTWNSPKLPQSHNAFETIVVVFFQTDLSDFSIKNESKKSNEGERRRENESFSAPRSRTVVERNFVCFCVFSLAFERFPSNSTAKSIIELAHDEWKLNYGFPSWHSFFPFVPCHSLFVVKYFAYRVIFFSSLSGKVFVLNQLTSFLRSWFGLLAAANNFTSKGINYQHPFSGLRLNDSLPSFVVCSNSRFDRMDLRLFESQLILKSIGT